MKNIHLREIDLTDFTSLLKGLDGIDIVICTANTAVPTTKNDNFRSVDETGVKSLISVSQKEGVKQIIFVSAAPFQKWDNKVPLTKAKRAVEKFLMGKARV